MVNPQVSIGMPVYNGERFIEETINSLLNQTCPDFEIIISDNASTDATEEICRQYAEKDKRIRYFRGTVNQGAAWNYRNTFELSKGDYFRWANCDDLFAPTSIEKCLEILKSDGSIILSYPKTRFIDAEGKKISDYNDGLHLTSLSAVRRFVELLQRVGRVNVIYGLIRSDKLRQTRLIRPFPGGDIPLLAELTLYGKFWEIPEILFFRRFHENAQSHFDSIKQIQEFFDPSKKEKIQLREWLHLMAHLGAVGRAPLEKKEKIRLLVFLSRTALTQRRALANEILFAIRKIL